MKIKLSSVLDLSRFLETKAGQELQDALSYLSNLSNEVITALTSNLSYADNFSCEIKRVSLQSGVETIISPSKTTSVREIRVRRIYDNNFYVVESIGWNYDESGNVKFKVSLSGSPPSGYLINMDIIIFYG